MLEVGTKIYNQGDMANLPCEGTIVDCISDKWGNRYSVQFEGRETLTRVECHLVYDCTVKGIGNGHYRIVTLNSYKNARKLQIEEMKRRYSK